MKKNILFFLLVALATMTPAMIFAEKNSTTCQLENTITVNDEKPFLIKDNSSYCETRGAVMLVDVNKVFSIPLKATVGTCKKDGKITIIGTYSYDKGNGTVLSANLNAYVSDVPQNYTVTISKQWTNINGTQIFQIVNYSSNTTDEHCESGGDWNNQVSLQIK